MNALPEISNGAAGLAARSVRWDGRSGMFRGCVFCGCKSPRPLLLVPMLAAMTLWAPARQPSASAQSPPDDRVPPLVSVKELRTWLADPRLRILDTRPGNDYVRGHVRGAVLVDVADWTRLSGTEEGLLDEETWAERIGGLGVARDSRVVVYGTSWPTSARIWWLLRFQGVRDARVLDGGWMAWRKDGAPIDNRLLTVDEAEFTPQPQIRLLATKPEIRHWLQKDSVQIVDARSAEEYRQHIPGAVHIEWSRLIDQGGHMRPAAALGALFREAGLSPQKPVVAYCRSGARASVMVIGLYRAGFPDVRNYYFSWNDWTSPPPGPIESASRGTAP